MSTRTRGANLTRGSTSVMAQRKEPANSLDYFPTPPWATRAFCNEILQKTLRLPDIHQQSVWDPACGCGDMARPLSEFFRRTTGTDVFDYSYHPRADWSAPGFHGQDAVFDFLLRWAWSPHLQEHPQDWIITNPPFRLGPEFITTALGYARVGVAMLLRTQFLEGGERYLDLYRPFPPTFIAASVERISMFKGKLMRRNNVGDKKKNSSTATSYTWFIWLKGVERDHPGLLWVPPCKKLYERDTDYEPEYR